jgi:hypothetical protein
MPGMRATPIRNGSGRDQRAFLRLVAGRVERAVQELAALQVVVRATVHASGDRRGVVVRLMALNDDGLPDPRRLEQAAFAGGYVVHALSDLQPRLVFAGRGQALLIPFPPPAASR